MKPRTRTHSAVERPATGSGVRPDCFPVDTNLNYSIHGESWEVAKVAIREGLSMFHRLHIHCYECGRAGDVLGGGTVRSGPDVANCHFGKEVRRRRNLVLQGAQKRGSIRRH